MSKPAPIRWGILGCGKISHDFVTAVRSLNPEENQQVVAVAARALSSAEAFAEQHQVPRAYGSYAQLVQDPDLDAVYIGTLNPAHHEQASQLLRAGRALLCEKPLCMNAAQTRALVALARARRVLLMEAVWTRCFPATRRLQEEVSGGAIGRLRHVAATFGVSLDPQGRVGQMSLGGGSVLDLGIYCAQLAVLVTGGRRWSQLQASGLVNEQGCDVGISATVRYPDGELATLVCHAGAVMDNQAVVAGDSGFVKMMAPFHCPTELVLPSGKSVTFPLPDSFEGASYNYCNSAGLQYEALHFAKCLREGLKESPLMPLDHTLLCAEMLEEMRTQLGVVYPEDSLKFDNESTDK